MNENTLNIFWDEEYSVGSIFRNTSGKIVFQYNPDWLRNKKKPISISLPCQEKAFSPAISKAFFENLLPESDVRAELAFNHRFDKKDTFSFLSHFGKDCAGALSILPENEVPDFTFGKYSRINEKLSQLLELIKYAPEKHRLFSGMSHARLSIAGAQDKLPVYIEGKDFYLPQNTGSPTSHIIKPANYFFKDIQRNETFCMSLAKEIGINVPKVDLVNFDGHEIFIIERYDRKRLEAVVKEFIRKTFVKLSGSYPKKNIRNKVVPIFMIAKI